jgi:outer membrane lipoprotein-sorting protein
MIPFYYRPIFLISAGLLLSTFLNVWFLYSAGKHSGEAKAAAQVTALQAKVTGYEVTATVNTELAKRAETLNMSVLNELEVIAERARETKVVYKDAARRAPLASNCAPGAERVNAVNLTLGPGDKP